MKNINKKTEILYGFHSVFEALNAKRRTIYRLFILDKCNAERKARMILLANSLDVKYEIVKNSRITLISKKNRHQGFSALVSPFRMLSIKNFIINHVSNLNSCLIIILDGIVDPHNFGAIIRTAHCFGVSGIIITKNRACTPTPSVSKISAGALEYMPICSVTNLSNTINLLQKKGFWIAGMDTTKKSINIFDTNLHGLVAFVIGNENKGLRTLVRRSCDFFVSIPMNGKIDSLNASVAAAVVMYESFRQKTTQLSFL